MDSRRWIRELLLVAVAAGMGWWWRGGDLKVFAQHSGSSSSARDGGSESLAFQFEGAGGQRSLAMWNPGNHTLYVYGGVTQGNAHVSCQYSFRIDRPGAPIERQNCPMGEQIGQ